VKKVWIIFFSKTQRERKNVMLFSKSLKKMQKGHPKRYKPNRKGKFWLMFLFIRSLTQPFSRWTFLPLLRQFWIQHKIIHVVNSTLLDFNPFFSEFEFKHVVQFDPKCEKILIKTWAIVCKWKSLMSENLCDYYIYGILGILSEDFDTVVLISNFSRQCKIF
jgi:hypothetical protein